MTDTLPSRQYVQTFLTQRPREGLTIVKDRQKQGKALDESLLQYFKTRALVEHQYAKSLTKASKQLFVTDRTTLGNFAPIWDLLASELTEISTTHEIMGRTTNEQVEELLKSAISPDCDRIKNLEPMFENLAKEFDQGSKTKRSSTGKGSLFKRMGSVAHRRQSRNISTTWLEDGPSFLESHQNVEEARLLRLKTLVEKFEQIQTDQLLKRLEIAQATMVAAHDYDIQKEIDDFCRIEGAKIRRHEEPLSRPSEHFNIQQEAVPVSPPVQEISDIVTRDSQSAANSDHPVRQYAQQSDPTKDRQFNDSFPQPPVDLLQASEQSKRRSSPGLGDRDGFDSSGVWSASSELHRFSQLDEPKALSFSDRGGSSAINANQQAFSNYDSNFSQEPDDISLDNSIFNAGPRLKFDIKQQPSEHEITDDNSEAAETFSRMATMLREKSPSVLHRMPRGRRQQIRSSYPGPPDSHSATPALPQSLSLIPGNTTGEVFNKSGLVAVDTNLFQQSSAEISTPTSMTTTVSSINYSPTFAPKTPLNLGSIHELNRPRLYVAITETIETSSTSVAGGKMQTFDISGAVQCSYSGSSAPTSSLLVRIKYKQPLESITPCVNAPYLKLLKNDDDVYTIHPQAFENDRGRPVTCLTYTASTANESLFPIRILKTGWRCEDKTSKLLVHYAMDDFFDIKQCRILLSVRFDDVPVKSVKNRPEGGWYADAKTITWTADKLLEHYKAAKQEGQVAKILAVFETECEGTPKPILLKYVCKGTAAHVSVETASSLGSDLEVQPMQAHI